MIPMSGKRAARAALLLVVSPLACQHSRIPKQELPAAPIAIYYRTPEQSRRHAQAADRDQQAEHGAKAVPGIARLDALTSLMRGVLGLAGAADDPARGRLALLDPRSGKVSVVAEALRGSVPLDWSADHTRLLFAQVIGDAVQLFELYRARETVRQLTRGPLSHVQGCYGPEGRIVAVETEADGAETRSRLVESAPRGAPPFEPISEGPADYSPTCAPAGGGVAFVRAASTAAAQEIWIAPPSRELPARRLTRGREPRFDASGEWIVFSAPLRSGWQLWRMRPDGSARAPLGSSRRAAASPTLSPDDRLVAYVSSEEPSHRYLYVRRFDGSGDRILYAHSDVEYPVW
jgi:Tol biopolymer transport system component